MNSRLSWSRANETIKCRSYVRHDVGSWITVHQTSEVF